MKECEFCKNINSRKNSVFCSNSCKNKNWYQNNKEKIKDKYLNNRLDILQYKKKYYEDNKDIILKRNKKWKDANMDWIRLYHNNRELSDEYRIRAALRSRISAALKGNYKSGSAVSDLGCSIEELKKHLENQFEPGMTWDNWSRDGWHIDHKTALAKFDLSDPEDFKKACHYTNLQPMWAEDNLIKGAK